MTVRLGTAWSELGRRAIPQRNSAKDHTPTKGQVLVACAYFALLSIVSTWPLIWNAGNAIVGEYGDNLYFVWLAGWAENWLEDPTQNFLISDSLNYPEGWRLASTEIAPSMILTGLPFGVVGGPVLAFNAAAIASFILSDIGMW